MAVGKNKRTFKSTRKGSKKKVIDPLSKKEWYDIRAPSIFAVPNIGKTVVSKTSGTKIASDSLKGRIFEVNLADLQNNEDEAYRKIKLVADDIQGRNILTSFYGMDFTTDKLRSLVKKWQTMIEAHLDVKTQDGVLVRMFCIAFTKRRVNQVKKTTYAQSSQIRKIRKRMFEVMRREAASVELKDLVLKLIPEAIGKQIEKTCQNIYPLHNVFIRKVKVLKRPKLDLGRLMDMHVHANVDAGQRLE